MVEAKVVKKGNQEMFAVTSEEANEADLVKCGDRVVAAEAFLRAGIRVKDKVMIEPGVASMSRYDRTPAPKANDQSEPEEETLGSKTVAQLKEIAEAAGVDLTGKTKKADIIAALEAALEVATDDEEGDEDDSEGDSEE